MNKKDNVPNVLSEQAQDLAHGQVVVVIARWILVVAGLVLMLWLPAPIEQLRVQILFILLLAIANFYLHAQLLIKRPTVELVAYGASAADMTLITILILLNGGLKSDLYIFYFPALLAVSVAFSTRAAFAFGGVVLVYYAALCFVSGIAARDLNEANLQIILTRLLMLAAVVFCGNLYWRIEQNRRQAAQEANQALPIETLGAVTGK